MSTPLVEAVDDRVLPRSARRARRRLQAAVELVVDSSDVAFATIRLTELGEHYLASHEHAASDLTELDDLLGSAVAAAGEVLLIQDARDDPRLAALDAVTRAPHVRSYIGAPIRGRDGRVVGVFGEYWTRPIPADPELLATVEILATWAGREFTTAAAEDAAGRVQRALRPHAVEPVPGYELAGRCVPALQIGGDFYDWHPVPGGLAVTLGDVMGKGVGAGMFAVAMRASLRGTSEADDPLTTVRITDAVLAGDFEAAESFSTLFHAHLRPEDGRLRFVDAGHGLTVVVRRDGGAVRLSSRNVPLGLLADQAWERQELTIEPGDTLVTVSDGVLDLYDGTLAAIDAVGDIARTSGTAQEIVDRISTMAASVTAPDDVTVVALRRDRA